MLDILVEICLFIIYNTVLVLGRSDDLRQTPQLRILFPIWADAHAQDRDAI